MPRLGNIQKETLKEVEITFESDPEPLKLTIMSSKFTLGWQRKNAEIAETNDIAAIADHFFDVVKDWNLLNASGKVIPLSPEGYDDLTGETFIAIMTKMTEQLRPNDETTSNS